jgi:hypothetical protein
MSTDIETLVEEYVSEASSLRGMFSFGPTPDQKRAQGKTTAKRKALKALRDELAQAEFALEVAQTPREKKKAERAIARIQRDLAA